MRSYSSVGVSFLQPKPQFNLLNKHIQSGISVHLKVQIILSENETKSQTCSTHAALRLNCIKARLIRT